MVPIIAVSGNLIHFICRHHFPNKIMVETPLWIYIWNILQRNHYLRQIPDKSGLVQFLHQNDKFRWVHLLWKLCLMPIHNGLIWLLQQLVEDFFLYFIFREIVYFRKKVDSSGFYSKPFKAIPFIFIYFYVQPLMYSIYIYLNNLTKYLICIKNQNLWIYIKYILIYINI